MPRNHRKFKNESISFKVTNNERLRESGFSIEGKTVNGYVTKDGVTININSAKSLNSVVGHEITHVLEGTDLYTELQSALFEYAKSKGEYDSRLETLTKLYEGVEGTDINAELCADLVGDYLFTDADFVNHLSSKSRNIFQKIYDEVKYLCKVATAGSKEARQLEKIKKTFDEAYKESERILSDDIKYALTSYGFEELTKETRNNMKMQGVEVIETKDYLKERIQGALSGEEKQRQFTLGALGDATKTKIETDTKQKLFKNRQYSFIVDGDDFIHISKHFSTPEEIANEVIRLFDIVSNYDKVEFKYEGNQKKLVFEKSYPHAEIRSIEVVSNNRNSLNLVTAFYTKKQKSI